MVPRPDNFRADVQYLNTCLAELDSRLGRAGPFSGSVPVSAFTRMDIALTLLVSDAEAPLHSALIHTAQSLQQIQSTLSSVQERCDPDLNPVWEQLADFFDDLLAKLDQGCSWMSLGNDPRWREIADRLHRASGPLGVMDRLNAEMVAWVNRWGQEDLLARQEAELGARWRRLRIYGDSLFEQGLLDDFNIDPGKKR